MLESAPRYVLGAIMKIDVYTQKLAFNDPPFVYIHAKRNVTNSQGEANSPTVTPALSTWKRTER